MSDLIERLRDYFTPEDRALHPICDEAADRIGADAATIERLTAERDRLTAENFALAAGQCANVTGDEGGTPRCAEISRLTAEVAALREDAERWRHVREFSFSYSPRGAWLMLSARKETGCDILSAAEVPALLDAEIDRRIARAAIDAARKEQT